MKSVEIRQSFIDYFVKNGHTFVPSSPTIPADDPTLLFTNAGMNQFKNTFLGLENRDYSRATNSQKCVRAGGKHNDLEAVGHTARHHTFFEMMGNFSFGDYFKKDAIHFAWELLTKEMGIDKDRLYVTVFETDDEAADIWHNQEGIPKDRIFRFGEKDNFWRMGETGPCGPCSEIFYDHGEIPGEIADPYKNIAAGGDRFVEIWNLVFMQYLETAPGQMSPLPNPSIDTGGGLERWAAALQGRPNNYDTDLFYPIIAKAASLSGLEYSEDPLKRPQDDKYKQQLVSLRVLADHARCAAFLLADGALPSNEGRGYVLRRIMRRAIRYARNLTDQSVYPAVVAAVIEEMGGFFGELKQRENVIMGHVKEEEKRFLTTLDTGTELLTDSLDTLDKKGQKVLDGETVFKLYDTFGFPADLTRVMATERGFQIDEAGFEQKMESARQKARASWKGGLNDSTRDALMAWTQDFPDTQFRGYETLNSEAQLLGLFKDEKAVESLEVGDTGYAIFDQTPFYAESGGQIGDEGEISGRAEIFDCQKFGQVFVHSVRVTESLSKGGVQLQVTSMSRQEVANHHSATHLMHAALRKFLGEHVTQAGSLVEVDRLRFDYSHNSPLTREQIEQIENDVNEQIARAIPVEDSLMSKDDALAAGALALFGEKYDDEVRVIKMGSYSTELCGGTHVKNTAQIRAFVIVSDSGVSAGVRRVEALCGRAAMRFLAKHQRDHMRALELAGAQQTWTQFLNNDKENLDLAEWVDQKKSEIKNLEKQLKAAKSGQVDINALVADGREFLLDGLTGRLVITEVADEDRKVLSEIADKLRDKVQTGVVIITGQGKGSHPLLIAVTKDISKNVHAGNMLKSMVGVLGGKGGGRPDFAQGAAESLGKWTDAVKLVEDQLGLS